MVILVIEGWWRGDYRIIDDLERKEKCDVLPHFLSFMGCSYQPFTLVYYISDAMMMFFSWLQSTTYSLLPLSSSESHVAACWSTNVAEQKNNFLLSDFWVFRHLSDVTVLLCINIHALWVELHVHTLTNMHICHSAGSVASHSVLALQFLKGKQQSTAKSNGAHTV